MYVLGQLQARGLASLDLVIDFFLSFVGLLFCDTLTCIHIFSSAF